MDFTEQPIGERKSSLQALEPMLEGIHIVGYLDHLIQRNSRDLLPSHSCSLATPRHPAFHLFLHFFYETKLNSINHN